ncbi:MAG: hypothetical protein AABP62_23750 [Planctomycetota bacterium]
MHKIGFFPPAYANISGMRETFCGCISSAAEGKRFWPFRYTGHPRHVGYNTGFLSLVGFHRGIGSLRCNSFYRKDEKDNMKRNLIVVVFLVFIAANISVLFFLQSRPISTALTDAARNNQARHAAATSRLSQWHSKGVVRLAADHDFERVIKSIVSQNCQQSDSSPITLTDDQTDNLHQAVIGLINVYSTNQPQALIDYMSSRTEKIDPKSVAGLRNILTKELAIDSGIAAEMTDDDVLKSYFELAKVNSHWSAIIDGEGCTQIHSVSTNNLKDVLQSLGKTDRTTFSNVNTFHHIFSGKRAFGEELASAGSVLLADVHFVVEYDQTFDSAHEPYYFRLWYDNSSRLWRPLQLVTIRTESSAPIMLVF